MSSPKKFWVSNASDAVDLSLRMDNTPEGSETPLTVMQVFKETVNRLPDTPALHWVHEGNDHHMTWSQYYYKCIDFAKSLMFIGFTPFASVNIIGFNSKGGSHSLECRVDARHFTY